MLLPIAKKNIITIITAQIYEEDGREISNVEFPRASRRWQYRSYYYLHFIHIIILFLYLGHTEFVYTILQYIYIYYICHVVHETHSIFSWSEFFPPHSDSHDVSSAKKKNRRSVVGPIRNKYFAVETHLGLNL